VTTSGVIMYVQCNWDKHWLIVTQ